MVSITVLMETVTPAFFFCMQNPAVFFVFFYLKCGVFFTDLQTVFLENNLLKSNMLIK